MQRADRPLQELLEELGIGADWDLLLVGDGSGSTWDRGCGWACVSVERATGARRVWYGAMNSGTNNLGELLAYLQPLTFFAADKPPGTLLDVHVVTDSRYAADTAGGGPVHGLLRRCTDELARSGLRITWHHLPRETSVFNVLADELGRRARKLLEGADLQGQVESCLDRGIYGVGR